MSIIKRESIRKNRDRIRNALIVTGGLVTVGVGAYFGVKKGFSGIQSQLEGVGKALDKMHYDLVSINSETQCIADMMNEGLYNRDQDRQFITHARNLEVPFEFFPGLGVLFSSTEDQSKVEKAVRGGL